MSQVRRRKFSFPKVLTFSLTIYLDTKTSSVKDLSIAGLVFGKSLVIDMNHKVETSRINRL